MMSRSAAPEALLFSGALTSVAKLGSPPARGRRSKAAGLKTVIPAQAKIQVLRTAHKAKKGPLLCGPESRFSEKNWRRQFQYSPHFCALQYGKTTVPNRAHPEGTYPLTT
jgi:hypothetical protein